MTVDQYLQMFGEALSRGHPGDEIIKAARQAVREHPGSAALLCALGDVLLGQKDCGRDAKAEALKAYDRAVAIDPQNAQARVAHAWFTFTVGNDAKLADQEFAQAIELGGGEEAFLGRASAQATLGRESDALKTVAAGLVDHPNSQALRDLEADINEGGFQEA